MGGTCGSTSAMEARVQARRHRARAARQRKYNATHGETAYSRYVLTAIKALELRAATEDTIAKMYEALDVAESEED